MRKIPLTLCALALGLTSKITFAPVAFDNRVIAEEAKREEYATATTGGPKGVEVYSWSRANNSYLQYLIQRGDTLWEIAAKECKDPVKYKFLATWNNIPNPDRIYAGRTLEICCRN